MDNKRLEIREYGARLVFSFTIDDAINMLTKYRDMGWTNIWTNKYEGDDGGIYYEYILYKNRPETDHEYTIRMKVAEDQKEIRRREYEKLKKEFGE